MSWNSCAGEVVLGVLLVTALVWPQRLPTTQVRTVGASLSAAIEGVVAEER